MAWDGIRKTGSLCLMMVSLATGALAQSTLTPLQMSVISAIEQAEDDGAPLNGVPGDLIMAVENANDTQVWTIYVDAFFIANPPGLPDPSFTYCVVSETGRTADGSEHSC